MTLWTDMAVTAMHDLLEQYLITNVPAGDPAIAASVRYGPLQDDPIAERIWVEVYENDPEGGWEHVQVTVNKDTDNPQYSDVIGRPRNVWNRRFLLRVNIFLENVDRETAIGIRGAVVERIEQMFLDHNTLDGLRDANGEYAINGRIVKQEGVQGGDRTDVNIWRGKLWVEFRTYRRR